MWKKRLRNVHTWMVEGIARMLFDDWSLTVKNIDLCDAEQGIEQDSEK